MRGFGFCRVLVGVFFYYVTLSWFLFLCCICLRYNHITPLGLFVNGFVFLYPPFPLWMAGFGFCRVLVGVFFCYVTLSGFLFLCCICLRYNHITPLGLFGMPALTIPLLYYCLVFLRYNHIIPLGLFANSFVFLYPPFPPWMREFGFCRVCLVCFFLLCHPFRVFIFVLDMPAL